ncbi:hypothetical protein PR003_g32676 [Phytophthora rubi]|uniref:Uncharacterized protein n=1 Tax=Phytophthora rubi TaxID=129364 RepID=A0A6A4B1G8_9STRA|nr:hypothetical protein PR002_g31351 [Phytophthora rubi]KAE9264779.1 hypothetical protein PR003_g32676 [Phytophthora rubi]
MGSIGPASEPDNDPDEGQSPEERVPVTDGALAHAPRMHEDVFESWKAFFTCFDAYQKEM